MFKSLKSIKNNNNSGEYYFTDIIEILGQDYQVDSYVVEDTYKLAGINDLITLKEIEEIYLKNKK